MLYLLMSEKLGNVEQIGTLTNTHVGIGTKYLDMALNCGMVDLRLMYLQNTCVGSKTLWFLDTLM